MKKSVITLTVLSILFASNIAMAEGFDKISNLTPVQKQKLNQIHFNYKQENNALETKIMSYQSKLAEVKNDANKSAQEKALIVSTYEKNISTLKAQQNAVKSNAEKLYQTVMTPAQYQQYAMQGAQAEMQINDFLKGANNFREKN